MGGGDNNPSTHQLDDPGVEVWAVEWRRGRVGIGCNGQCCHAERPWAAGGEQWGAMTTIHRPNDPTTHQPNKMGVEEWRSG